LGPHESQVLLAAKYLTCSANETHKGLAIFGLPPPNFASDFDFQDIKTHNFGGMKLFASTNAQLLVRVPLLHLKRIKCKPALHNKRAETKERCPLDLCEIPIIIPIK
jgi:hypothetical protein